MKKRLSVLLAVLLTLTLLPGAALAATVKVTADPAALAAEGSAKITVNVTNDGAVAMENITISNPYQLLFETSGAVVSPGETKKFSVNATIPDSLLNQALTFDLSWTEDGEPKTGSGSVTILRGSASGVSLTRTASSTNASPGETVTIKYMVTNSGIVALKKISLNDSEIAGKTTPVFKDISLAPGEFYEFSYQFEMGYETVTSAPVVTYTPEGESAPQTFSAIASLQIGMVNTKLSMQVEQGASSAEGVTFSIYLTNTGNQKLRNISVKDELANVVEKGFSLAVGEKKQLTYKVQTDEERYVSFSVSASSEAGQNYEDKTKSFVVRKYIDPALLGVDFKAEVLETLNSAGSIKVKFTFLNTGELEMKDLVLSEQAAGVIYTLASLPAGEQSTEQTMYVGEPRNLVFNLSLTDPAGTPYTYVANIGATFLGDGFLATAATPEPIEEPVESIGESVGGAVRTALKTALFVLGVLTLVAGIALIVLTVLERKERERIARAKRRRERLLREQQANSGFTADLGNTQVNKRPPTER